MKKNQINFKNSIESILLILIGSVIFSLSHPNFIFSEGLSFLAWICFVPLFWVTHKSSLKSAWAFGFFYGVISYAFLVWWVYNYNTIFFLLIILVCGIYHSLLFEILKLSDFIFQKAGIQKYSWILSCLILISFEFIKTKGFLGFSYGVIGYTQWKIIPLIQLANILGVYGISALIIFFSGIIYGILIRVELKNDFKSTLEKETYHTAYSPVTFATKIERQRKTISFGSMWIAIAVWVLAFSGSIIYGTFLKFQYDKSSKIKIAAIQHNENSRENGIESYSKNIQKLISLTNEAVDLNPDIKIIVWPETSVVPSIMYQYNFGVDSERKKVVNSLLEFINSSEQTFVVGNFHREKVKDSDGKLVNKDYNSALVFTPKENVIPPAPESYYKTHLVPLSEEFPFSEQFPKITKKLESLGVTFWEKGTECTVFEKDGFYFSTPICFENTFPEIARKMYKAGSRCLISLTNDSWAKSEAAQNQHLSMTVFRSVENKIPGIVSATSGATCAIGADGHIIKMATPFVETYCVAEISIISENRASSVYTKFGDVLGNVCVIISFALLIIGLIICIIKICQNR